MEEKIVKVCPNCKKEYTGYGAISRKDNTTEICSKCGEKEAIESFNKYKKENPGKKEA